MLCQQIDKIYCVILQKQIHFQSCAQFALFWSAVIALLSLPFFWNCEFNVKISPNRNKSNEIAATFNPATDDRVTATNCGIIFTDIITSCRLNKTNFHMHSQRILHFSVCHLLLLILLCFFSRRETERPKFGQQTCYSTGFVWGNRKVSTIYFFSFILLPGFCCARVYFFFVRLSFMQSYNFNVFQRITKQSNYMLNTLRIVSFHTHTHTMNKISAETKTETVQKITKRCKREMESERKQTGSLNIVLFPCRLTTPSKCHIFHCTPHHPSYIKRTFVFFSRFFFSNLIFSFIHSGTN